MGRPTKYSPEYCEVVADLGHQGWSVAEVAAHLGLDRKTIEQHWPAHFPEFAEAFQQYKTNCQAWWERTGREGMLSRSICPTIYAKSMNARFPREYRDNSRVEVTGADGEALQQKVTVEFVKKP